MAMSKRTFSVKVTHSALDTSACAISLHKDGNQVAVAGRTVFKVYDINDENETFVETHNLRTAVGKEHNYNFIDVAWCPHDEAVLATSTANGAVVIWNLLKPARSKLDTVLHTHKRTVNKISFHPTEPGQLLTGSQDGKMILFDIRTKKEQVASFYSSNESVRDVQFSPHQSHKFASVQENGGVFIWDMRRPERHERQFTAHSGPVFCCDFHPEDRRLLATAGRDKSIKVWDLKTTNLESQINTFTEVARIKWRPDRKTYIASIALSTDYSINIWDTRRPYVPYAMFIKHKDVCTSFVWRNDPRTLLSVGKDNSLFQYDFEDAYRPAYYANPIALDVNNHGDITAAISDSILKAAAEAALSYPSTTRDNTAPSAGGGNSFVVETNTAKPASSAAASVSMSVTQQQQQQYDSFKSSVSPTSSTSVTLPVQRDGKEPGAGGTNLINSLFSTLGANSSLREYATGKISSMFHQKKQQTPSEQFKDCKSILRTFKNQNADRSLSMDWFVKSALGYQLTGRPFNELCAHNAEVAYRLSRPQVAQTWLMLQQLYNVSAISRISQFSGSFVNVQSAAIETGASGESKDERNQSSNTRHASGSFNGGGGTNTRNLSGNSKAMSTQTGKQQVLFSVDDPDNSNNNSDTEDESNPETNLLVLDDDIFKSSGITTRFGIDFFFGDGDILSGVSSFDQFDINSNIASEDMSLDEPDGIEEIPREAFNLRHVIQPLSIPGLWQGEAGNLDICISPDSLDEELHHHQMDEQIEDAGYSSARETNNDIDALCQSILSSFMPPPTAFDINSIVVKMLNYYAADGDVQMCVSVLLVLGDRLKQNSIEESTLENWYNSYIDLLMRFQLWNQSNQVIKLCPLASIRMLNQTSTSLKIGCAKCGKVNNKPVAWTCRSCQVSSSRCAVCHLPVTGLYVWCQGCSHGGHINHIQDWLLKTRYCPTGCGHQCEYT